MTFDEYISNPMGKKNAVFSQREVFREIYTKKLDAILVREVGKVKYQLYYDKKNNKYYVHFKMPSEPIKDFYYDTVIEFYTKDHGISLGKTLSKYDVKFYSNDPSFMFTFAHAMKKNNMFIKDLEPRMAKKALKEVGKEKNPKDEVGYVKSIFFAYLLMKNYGLFAKVQFDSYAKPYNRKELLNNVTQAEEKVQARIDAGEELRKEKANERRKQERADQRKVRREENPINIQPTGNVKKSNKVSHVKKATANKVKRVKKI